AGRGGDLQLPHLSESSLSSIEVKAYGVELSSLLRTFTRWLHSSNRISGRVAENSGALTVFAQYDRPVGDPLRWLITEPKTPDEASFALACRIVRALEAERSPLYTRTSDMEFFEFTKALRTYQRYADQLTQGGEDKAAQDSLNEALKGVERT